MPSFTINALKSCIMCMRGSAPRWLSNKPLCRLSMPYECYASGAAKGYIENSLVLSRELGDSGAHNPVQSMDDLRMTEKKQQAREISGVAPNCRISDAESTDCQKAAGSLI